MQRVYCSLQLGPDLLRESQSGIARRPTVSKTMSNEHNEMRDRPHKRAHSRFSQSALHRYCTIVGSLSSLAVANSLSPSLRIIRVRWSNDIEKKVLDLWYESEEKFLFSDAAAVNVGATCN